MQVDSPMHAPLEGRARALFRHLSTDGDSNSRCIGISLVAKLINVTGLRLYHKPSTGLPDRSLPCSWCCPASRDTAAERSTLRKRCPRVATAEDSPVIQQSVSKAETVAPIRTSVKSVPWGCRDLDLAESPAAVQVERNARVHADREIRAQCFDSQVDSHAGANGQTAADKTAVRSAILRWRRLSADVHKPPTNRLIISGLTSVPNALPLLRCRESASPCSSSCSNAGSPPGITRHAEGPRVRADKFMGAARHDVAGSVTDSPLPHYFRTPALLDSIMNSKRVG
jgi:hypothetical protein